MSRYITIYILKESIPVDSQILPLMKIIRIWRMIYMKIFIITLFVIVEKIGSDINVQQEGNGFEKS